MPARQVSLMGLCIALALSCPPAQACSTFASKVNDEVVVGKNLDWFESTGALIFSPAGRRKHGLYPDAEKLFHWRASYSSLTFVQHSLDHPLGGMNQKGLVVEILVGAKMLSKPSEKRPNLNSVQFIQYLLDTFQNVKEVATHLPQRSREFAVVPLRGTPSVKYFVADKFGESLVLEYDEDNLRIYDSSPVPLTNNSPYEISLAHLQSGALSAELQTLGYLQASRSRKELKSAELVSWGFRGLNFLKGNTKADARDFNAAWQVLYFPKQNRISWRVDTRKEQTCHLSWTQNLWNLKRIIVHSLDCQPDEAWTDLTAYENESIFLRSAYSERDILSLQQLWDYFLSVTR